MFVYFLAFLKNVIYGLTVFFTGSLVSSTSVMDVLALRFLMSAIVMYFLKVIKIIKIDISIRDFFVKNERSEYIKPLICMAIFEPILYMFFETIGVSMTTGVTAGVILSLSPISSCIAEEVILKEKSSMLQKVLLGLGIVGATYIVVNTNSTDGKNTVIGMLCLVLAAVTGSLYSVFTRKCASAFNAMERTYIACVLGAVVFNAINIVRHVSAGDLRNYFNPYFDWNNMLGFFMLAVVSTIVATGMQNYAMGKMQVSTMAAFGGVSTMVTIAVGVFIGGEKLQGFHAIGLSLIVLRMMGVSYLAIRKNKR